jgi:hypothetical protein
MNFQYSDFASTVNKATWKSEDVQVEIDSSGLYCLFNEYLINSDI